MAVCQTIYDRAIWYACCLCMVKKKNNSKALAASSFPSPVDPVLALVFTLGCAVAVLPVAVVAKTPGHWRREGGGCIAEHGGQC